MDYSIEEKVKIYEFLMGAMESDNMDYILAQLNNIYRYIIKNNFGGDVDYNNAIILDNEYINAIIKKNLKDNQKLLSEINKGNKDVNEYLIEL